MARWSGLSLVAPIPSLDGLDDPQRRILGATIGGVRVIDLYVVNGKEVGSDKYDYKLDWLKHVTRWIAREAEQHENVIVLGDFNIAPEDRDVHDPEAWHERILCSTPEREALQEIMDIGFTDTFRMFEQEEKSWSWWDYRAAAFRRNMGLRIDPEVVPCRSRVDPRRPNRCMAAAASPGEPA